MRRRLRAWRALTAGLVATVCITGGGYAANAIVGVEAKLAWSPPRPLLSVTPACPTQHRPAFAVRGDGNMVAVWYDGPDSRIARLLWSERAPGADRWSPPLPVGPAALGYWDDGPARLTRLADGSLMLAWRGGARDPERPRPLRLALLGPAVGVWRSVAAPGGTEQGFNAIELAANAKGLHAVWADGQGILYARRGANGVWTRPEGLRSPGRKIRVETSAGLKPMATSGFAPVIATAPNGAVLVGWWDDEQSITPRGGYPFDLLVRTREPGRAWSAVETVGGARSPDPAAAAAATRRGFTLVSVGADGQLYARQRAFGPGAWSVPAAIGQEPSRRAIDPALATSNDALLLTWRSFGKGEGSNRMLAASAVDASGFTVTFASPTLDAEDPRQGGLFDARGRAMLWLGDAKLRPPCTGVVWSEAAAALNTG